MARRRACLTSSLTAPGSTAKDTIIGAGVGGAVGGIASFALLFNTHNFFLDVGSPVEMVLQQPLTLEQDQVAEAIRDASSIPYPSSPSHGARNPRLRRIPAPAGPRARRALPASIFPARQLYAVAGNSIIHIPGIPPTPPTASSLPITAWPVGLLIQSAESFFGLSAALHSYLQSAARFANPSRKP